MTVRRPDDDLLRGLLTAPPPTTPELRPIRRRATARYPVPPPLPPRPWYRDPVKIVRRLGLMCGAVAGLGALYLILTLGPALLSIRASMQAMRATEAPLGAGDPDAAANSQNSGPSRVIAAEGQTSGTPALVGAAVQTSPTPLPVVNARGELVPARVQPTMSLSQLRSSAPDSLRATPDMRPRPSQPPRPTNIARQPSPMATSAPRAGAPATITPIPLNNPAGTPALATLGPGVDNRPAPPAGDAINVLLLGVDRRPDEVGQPVRADAIMLARIEPARQRIAFLSFPRDLIVLIPGYGYGRINAAHVYGDLNPALGGGRELTRQTVSNLIGEPIDYTVSVDFQGFIAAVDALGGVDINVEKEIYDPRYPTMDYGYEILHFLPGEQAMDGATALKYARTRHADSDWERGKRQQQVLQAIGAKIRSQNMLSQVQSIARVLESLRPYIETDLPEERVIGLAFAFRGAPPDGVQRYSLDSNYVTTGADPSDPYAQYPIAGAIAQLVAEWKGGP